MRRIIIPVLLFLVVFSAPAQTVERVAAGIVPGAPACNLIRNGDFSQGLNVTGDGSMPGSSVSNWTLAFGSPQIGSIAGCAGTPGLISMWGNETVGEAIQQQLAAPLVSGHSYRLTACVRWMNNNPTLPPYVRFKVRGSVGSLTAYATSGTVLGIIGAPTNNPPIAAPGITSTQWQTVSFDFTVSQAFDTITINPVNNNTANDGNTVSWGQIDNVCLQDLKALCPPLNPEFSLTSTLTAPNSTTFGVVATTTALPPGAGFWWQVEEIDAAGNAVPGTTVTNPSAWWPTPLTNNFGGYNGSATLGNTSTPGAFKQGHKYRITRGVWDLCHPWTQAAHSVLMSTP